MSQINQQTIELIKKFEGLSLTKYICPAGIPTIGYGHQLLANEDFTQITESKADELLLNDIDIAANAVLRLINVPLTDNQFGALTSFCFNLGSAALQRSSLRQKLNRLEYICAAAEFNKWIFAGSRKLPGLILRRAAETELFLTN